MAQAQTIVTLTGEYVRIVEVDKGLFEAVMSNGQIVTLLANTWKEARAEARELLRSNWGVC